LRSESSIVGIDPDSTAQLFRLHDHANVRDFAGFLVERERPDGLAEHPEHLGEADMLHKKAHREMLRVELIAI